MSERWLKLIFHFFPFVPCTLSKSSSSWGSEITKDPKQSSRVLFPLKRASGSAGQTFGCWTTFETSSTSTWELYQNRVMGNADLSWRIWRRPCGPIATQGMVQARQQQQQQRNSSSTGGVFCSVLHCYGELAEGTGTVHTGWGGQKLIYQVVKRYSWRGGLEEYECEERRLAGKNTNRAGVLMYKVPPQYSAPFPVKSNSRKRKGWNISQHD